MFLKKFTSPLFWGVPNAKDFLAKLIAVIDEGFGGQNIFAGDNLVAVGRNLAFLDDDDFMRAFNSVITRENFVGQGIIWRIYIFCWAAKNALLRDGDFVECGVASGTLSSIMCHYLKWETVNKTLHLFDAWDVDERVDTTPYGGNSLNYVTSVFSRYSNVCLHPGFIPDTLVPNCLPNRISFLHIDLNNAAAEICVLESMFERMSAGSVLLLDDFGHAGFAETQRAQVEWLRKRGYTPAELPTGQGLVIK